jgi:hypothetical protein
MFTAMTTQLLSLLVRSAISAIIIQYAARMVAGFKPLYKSAFLASLAANLLAAAIMMVVSLAGVRSGNQEIFIGLVLTFVSGTLCYSRMLKSEDSAVLGLKKGALVSAVEVLLYVIVVVCSLYVYSSVRKTAPPLPQQVLPTDS